MSNIKSISFSNKELGVICTLKGVPEESATGESEGFSMELAIAEANDLGIDVYFIHRANGRKWMRMNYGREWREGEIFPAWDLGKEISLMAQAILKQKTT